MDRDAELRAIVDAVRYKVRRHGHCPQRASPYCGEYLARLWPRHSALALQRRDSVLADAREVLASSGHFVPKALYLGACRQRRR